MWHTITSLSFISVLVLGCGQVTNKIIWKRQIFTTVHTVSTYTPVSWHLEYPKLLQIALFMQLTIKITLLTMVPSSQVELVAPTSKVCATTTLLVLIMQNKKMSRVIYWPNIHIKFHQNFQASLKVNCASRHEDITSLIMQLLFCAKFLMTTWCNTIQDQIISHPLWPACSLDMT